MPWRAPRDGARRHAQRLRFADTDRVGLYAVAISGQPLRVFAVNAPAGGESDLARMIPAELPATGTGEDPQVVTDPAAIKHRPSAAAEAEQAPADAEPGRLGTAVARGLLLAVLVLLFLEPVACKT